MILIVQQKQTQNQKQETKTVKRSFKTSRIFENKKRKLEAKRQNEPEKLGE